MANTIKTSSQIAREASALLPAPYERGMKYEPSQKARTAFNSCKNAGSKSAAMKRIGQGFIGPVMMRLKYEGMARNVLTEDVIPVGEVPIYDVADEMGRAYFLEDYQGEAMISQFEGKRVQYGFRRLAAFPTIQEVDLYELTIDMANYAMEEARQRIMEEEDGYLFALLDTAIENIDVGHPDYAGITSHVITTVGDFKPADFYAAAKIAGSNRLASHNIILHNADYFDMLAWNHDETSIDFKNRTFDGTPVTTFAQFNVFQSVICPAGTAYVLPDSDYLGRFPVRKQLDIEDNPKVETFTIGWVMSELIQMLILNSNGAVKIVKS